MTQVYQDLGSYKVATIAYRSVILTAQQALIALVVPQQLLLVIRTTNAHPVLERSTKS